MSCKDIFWYDLPNTIKKKIKPFDAQLSKDAKNITWYNLPNKLTKLYNELSLIKPSCKKDVDFMWYDLPKKAQAICSLIDCLSVIPLNKFTFTVGNAPTISAFESTVGFSLINGFTDGTVISFDNSGYTIPFNSFKNNIKIVKVEAVNNATAEGKCFDSCTFLESVSGFSVLGGAAFMGCIRLTNMDFSNCIDFGGSVNNDSVFTGISGLNITLKAKAIHQTSNGGAMEGDLAELIANNTVTVTWV